MVTMRAMTLDEYLRTMKLTSAQFAETAGIPSKQTVHNYRHGLRFPTAANLVRIREITQGLVTADDFANERARRSAAEQGGI